MSVITPAPVPASNDNFYKEIEQLQSSFKQEQSKIKVDVESRFNCWSYLFIELNNYFLTDIYV